jgi:hypothetical protein
VLPIPEDAPSGRVRLVVSAVGLTGSASAGEFLIAP